MVTAFKNSKEYKRGNKGEIWIAHFHRQDGWFVIPTYDFSGENNDKAPKMVGPNGEAYVLPDLNLSKNGKQFWIEVKTKSEQTFHRNTKRFEHGIPWRHYKDYLKVEEITGCSVFLFICELDTRNILYKKLKELGAPRYSHSPAMGTMAFWTIDRFDIYDKKLI